jgi:hypothetical protein
MAKYLQIDYPDGGVVLVGRVARSRLGALEALLQVLQQRWLAVDRSVGVMVSDPATWDIFLRIANLLPRYDVPGQLGFDLEPLRKEWEQLEELFICQGDESNYQPCKLVEMLRFEPTPRPAWQEDLDPIPSSGDSEMDLLAGLAVGFSAREAIELWNLLDAESIDRFLAHTNELRRDPEDRQMENLAEDFAAWKADNAVEYQEILD